MDDESFTPGGALKMIEFVMNNSYTALSRSQSAVVETAAYKKCKVKIKSLTYLNRYLDTYLVCYRVVTTNFRL